MRRRMLQNIIEFTGKSKSRCLQHQVWYTFDTEMKDGFKKQLLYCWSLWNGVNLIQGDESDLYRLFQYFEERYQGIRTFALIYVQNLGFDANHILHSAKNQGYAYFPIESTGRLLQMNFTKILKNGKELKIIFRDSWQFLEMSQEEAEKKANIDESLRKIDCKEIFKKAYSAWSVKEKQLVIDHNVNDVKALYEILTQYREILFKIAGVDFIRFTSLPKMVLECYRVHQGKDFKVKNPLIFARKTLDGRISYEYDELSEKFIRMAYRGGMTDVYNEALWENVAYLDFVSQYASIMHDTELPSGNFLWVEKHDKKIIQNIISGVDNRLAILNVRCYPPKSHIDLYPLLGVKYDLRNEYHNTEHVGVYTSVELSEAYKSGWRFEPEIIELSNEKVKFRVVGVIWEEKLNYFKDYVDKFLPLKKSQGLLSVIAKKLVNALYGKFGEEFERDAIKRDYFNSYEACKAKYEEISVLPGKTNLNMFSKNGLWFIFWKEEVKKVKPYMITFLAVFISALGRVKLNRKIKEFYEKGISVIYSDTDSIVIPKSDIGKVVISNEMGEMNIEKEYQAFKALASKLYIGVLTMEKGKTKYEFEIRAKGIDKNDIEKVVKKYNAKLEKLKRIGEVPMLALQNMILEIQSELKILPGHEKGENIKEALRGGEVFKTKTTKKRLTMENKKRNFLSDGSSVPWNDESILKRQIATKRSRVKNG